VCSATSALVLITDAQDHIVWANTAFTTTTGWALEHALRCQPMELLHHPGADATVLAQVHQALAAGQGTRHEWLHRARCGVNLWLDVDLRPVHHSTGKLAGYVRVATDATERRRLQDQLRTSARTDALTLLPNRAVVLERLQRALAHVQHHPGYGFALLLMDFDRFKQVNDTLGHGAGDDMLRQVAARLQATLRPGDAVARLVPEAQRHGPQGQPVGPDVAAASLLAASAAGLDPLAARLGGDEFVVVLDGVADPATVARLADRMLADLAQPYVLGSTPVQSGVSIGVVLVGGPTAQTGEPAGAASDRPSAESVLPSAECLLRNADTAMYEAKRAGRGRWVLFNPSMHERVVRALAMERDLKRALAADELFVVYQPVVDLATRAVTGVEALVRWRHPTRGLVPPLDFIPLAEECGLIDAVGAVVLRLACTQFVQWQHTLGERAPRLLAVNLSRAQLQRAGLVADVRELLASCGMAPQQLQLEVTESLAAQDERVQTSLRELKSLGVKLALDDFGTGYSSLACLHLLPVDTVKIDRSFVQHAQTVDYHRVLIEATIRVAQTLGMTTVAEGIETEGQAALMLQLACDRGQGYLFAKPLDAAALQAWVCQGDSVTA
jgi:PAS domain S-box-containing protein